MESIKIGLIIPTYNHGSIIRKVVLSALEYIPDILVVLDGPTDNTSEAIKDLPIKILPFLENRGKGMALKAGFQEAKKLGWDYAITMDSDGQHKAEDLPKFIKAIAEKPDAIVVGDRNMDLPGIPSSSKFGKKFTNFWLKVETGVEVADGQSGFRAYPVEAINTIKTWFSRYEFEVEILARSSWAGIPIVAIPVQVDYHPEGRRISHFRPFIDNFRTSILNTILVTIRILMLIKRFKKIAER
ncbi:MAG: glycosyltransferase family 2 protein [Candidatus Brocadiae bacterium]|nr:glycosyltransferase family 2 protein [Candidatus Brocadiia bacterium]